MARTTTESKPGFDDYRSDDPDQVFQKGTSTAVHDDEHRDPLSGAPGAHPVGTGVGATTGGLAGAAIGSFAGPLGSIAGLIIGAVAGGYAGKGVGEAINHTEEEAFWRENFHGRPYLREGERFETYHPAYRYGWESYDKHTGRTFEEAEPHLESNWDRAAGASGLSWDQAREATRDSWMRIDERVEQLADNYWRENFKSRSYVEPGATYERYRYAFQLGRKAHARYPDKFFDDVEDELKDEWNRIRQTLSATALSWDQAREAIRDGWNHADFRMQSEITPSNKDAMSG